MKIYWQLIKSFVLTKIFLISGNKINSKIIEVGTLYLCIFIGLC